MSDHRAKRRRIVEEDEEDADNQVHNSSDEEAVEVNDVEEAEPSEDEGEDLLENLEADYVAIPELDTYDMGMLDQRDYDVIDFDARRRAEEEIDARRAQRTETLREILDEYGDEDEEARDRRRAMFDRLGRETEDQEVVDEEINLEAFNVPLREWIAQDRTRREVKRRFRIFLTEFKEVKQDQMSMEPYYQVRIRAMCAANQGSLEVLYTHMGEASPILAIWLADAPKDMLAILDEVLNEVVLQAFPNYKQIVAEVHVRIAGLPIEDKLRDLRQSHLNALIRVSGVVTRRTGVFPQMKLIKFSCARCQFVFGPFKQEGQEVRPGSCPRCQSSGPFRINQEETIYGNYQRITLQESPSAVPPGRVPRHKEIILLGDLIDRAKPGEEIELTGIFLHSHNRVMHSQSGFPVFSTNIEANHIQKREDIMATTALTEEDRRAIHELSRNPKIADMIIRSIAPSIYGHRHVKTAVALALFGGVSKDSKGHRIRGDINVLLLGDPGTAKSQMLKYAEKTAPRAVYTTGKGASAVGLTAGVHKDPLTKEWTVEGGALVLADRGVCLIDEFDKMSDSDRTSIHEAMEQQSISLSKAGIVTSLQARCSVIAAANPIGGRYDPTFTLAENVELTDPILQRFDITCVLQDTVDPIADERLAAFVVGSHMRNHPNSNEVADDATAEVLANHEQPDLIPQDLLKKYIMYARTMVTPQLRNIDVGKIQTMYADLRAQSKRSGAGTVGVRALEAVIRIAEAHARMHLRDYVRDEDTDAAIRVMLESFLQGEKVSTRNALQHKFRKYITTSEEANELLMHMLQRLIRDVQKFQMLQYGRAKEVVEVPIADLETMARDRGIHSLQNFYASNIFKTHDLFVDQKRGVIIKRF